MAYVLPLRANDLGVKERYHTGTHGAGIQGQGKDIGAFRFLSSNKWDRLSEGKTDWSKRESYVAYGKRFYAMAAGTVVGGWRNAPENDPPTRLFPSGKVVEKPDPALTAEKVIGGGNHLWILQDDGVYALYAHAIPGTIPDNLGLSNDTLITGPYKNTSARPDIYSEAVVTGGARVRAGQFLGQIGMSGYTLYVPHLHVHMEKNGNPVAMPFERGMTTPFVGTPDSNGTAKFNGPWTKLGSNTLPNEVLVWAPHSVGAYTFNGTSAAEFQSLFDHMSDSGMMPEDMTCESNGAYYNAKWIPSKGTWVAFAGSIADMERKDAVYKSQNFKLAWSHPCGTSTVAVWRK
jgi:hypothetical protein